VVEQSPSGNRAGLRVRFRPDSRSVVRGLVVMADRADHQPAAEYFPAKAGKHNRPVGYFM